MNITVSLQRSYVSKNGNDVFVYAVKASGKDLEAFKTAAGDFLREDEQTKEPLWFTTRCIGKTGKLVVTTKGKIVPDMSAYKQAASLAKQFGGNFGQELARASVQNLLGVNTPDAGAEEAASE